MNKISTEKGILKNINKDKKIKLIMSDNYAEIISAGRVIEPPHYHRISSNQYINRDTGEIKDYSTTDNRILSVDSLRKTYKRLDWIIKSNFKGEKSEVFLTLGYDSQMNDYETLKQDFNSFRKKFDRAYPKCEYIVVVEYKGNGDLHLHILIKSLDNKRLFLNRKLLVKLWGQNSVYIKRVRGSLGVDKLAWYLNPFKNKDKFGRLMFYKRNFKIYRRSKGIKTPQVITLTYDEAQKMLNDNNYKEYYSSSYSIVGEYSNGQKSVFNDVTIIQFRKDSKNEKTGKQIYGIRKEKEKNYD